MPKSSEKMKKVSWEENMINEIGILRIECSDEFWKSIGGEIDDAK